MTGVQTCALPISERVYFGIPFEIAVDVDIIKCASKTAMLVIFAQGETRAIPFPAEPGTRRSFSIQWTIRGSAPRVLSVGAYLHHDPLPTFASVSVLRPSRIRSLIRAESETVHVEIQLVKVKPLPDNARWMASGHSVEPYGINELINCGFPLLSGDSLTRRIVPVLFGDDWDYPMTRDAIILRALAIGDDKPCEFNLLCNQSGADAYPETRVSIHRRKDGRIQFTIRCRSHPRCAPQPPICSASRCATPRSAKKTVCLLTGLANRIILL